MEVDRKRGMENMLSEDDWLVKETAFNPKKINYYETIFTVGNGYQGTRGALEEGFRGGLSATYLAGVFDHYDSAVVDLVNAPDWLSLRIYVDGQVLDCNTCKIVAYKRTLDMKQGLLHRHTIFEDPAGRRTRYESIRFASFAQQHISAMRVQLTPENYEGDIILESWLDGHRRNLDRLPQYLEIPEFPVETKWEKWATSKHLKQTASIIKDDSIYLEMKTLDRDHRIAYAASVNVEGAIPARSGRQEYEKVGEIFTFYAKQGKTYQFDKMIAIGTSRDVPVETLQNSCMDWLQEAVIMGFDACMKANTDSWDAKWEDADCTIKGDAEASLAMRFNIYHLLITANENDPKVNIGAKSLSGEGYKGHVFWDTEIFLLPFYIYTQPETAKALLMYRYHCLEAAQENAQSNGFKGSQYPWESADTGEEVTPKWTHDGKYRIWTGEEEIHITADVAYGVITYFIATGDWSFMLEYGMEILLNTARFWDSRLEHNADKDRYELNQVIGPDEFHEHVNNNVFTNWLAKWNLQKAIDYYELLKLEHTASMAKLTARLNLSDDEVADWLNKVENIYIPFDKDKHLIEQFEGYFNCKEEPITEWDENQMPLYPKDYNHFTAQETTLVKQPDVVMLMYVLPDEFDDEIKRINYEFYEQRTMHKSSLSPSIHSIMGIEVGDTSRAVQYFQRSAFVDLVDNQGNTDMGVHAASAGGTWMCLVFGFGGFRVMNQQMTFKPWLPEDWGEIKFRLKWKGDRIEVTLTQNSINFYRRTKSTEILTVLVNGTAAALPPNSTLETAL